MGDCGAFAHVQTAHIMIVANRIRFGAHSQRCIMCGSSRWWRLFCAARGAALTRAFMRSMGSQVMIRRHEAMSRDSYACAGMLLPGLLVPTSFFITPKSHGETYLNVNMSHEVACAHRLEACASRRILTPRVVLARCAVGLCQGV